MSTHYTYIKQQQMIPQQKVGQHLHWLQSVDLIMSYQNCELIYSVNIIMQKAKVHNDRTLPFRR